MPYDITEARRLEYREMSLRSKERKRLALDQNSLKPLHPINVPKLDPAVLMPKKRPNGLTALSLFSGGGGLDVGFERAGFAHAGSFEILDICGTTLKANRPKWAVHAGAAGDVTRADWSHYASAVSVVHGGPPCQPFSIAGNQKGAGDERNMWPSFIRAVLSIRPPCFVAENVPGLLDSKFGSFVQSVIEAPLRNHYKIARFILSASAFGVPQSRRRVFFVGFRDEAQFRRFQIPAPTHCLEGELAFGLERCMGVREALGLPEIGADCLAPTIRSGFTGPRNSTGIVNSKASLEQWSRIGIWPHGVQRDRLSAHHYPPENGHFRLSIPDCAVLQGFPPDWRFSGAVYQALGQIGNSVCPPVAYHLARAVASAMRE